MSMSGAVGGLGVIEGEATDNKGLQRSVGFNGLFCIASTVSVRSWYTARGNINEERGRDYLS